MSIAHAVNAEVRLYDHLFSVTDPNESENYKECLNPDSLEVLKSCQCEPGLRSAKPGNRFQFLRQGYFCVDKDSGKDKLVFNRTVSLKDSWAKIAKKQ